MNSALQLLRATGGMPRIVFVGQLCRTWHDDEDVMCAVMEILRSAREFAVVYMESPQGPWGFDRIVHRVASLVGLPLDPRSPEVVAQDGRCMRDHTMLEDAIMVVAFPDEKAPLRDSEGGTLKSRVTQEKWSTADPAMATTIEQLGVPVLAVHRDGRTYWIETRTT